MKVKVSTLARRVGLPATASQEQVLAELNARSAARPPAAAVRPRAEAAMAERARIVEQAISERRVAATAAEQWAQDFDRCPVAVRRYLTASPEDGGLAAGAESPSLGHADAARHPRRRTDPTASLSERPAETPEATGLFDPRPAGLLASMNRAAAPRAPRAGADLPTFDAQELHSGAVDGTGLFRRPSLLAGAGGREAA